MRSKSEKKKEKKSRVKKGRYFGAEDLKFISDDKLLDLRIKDIDLRLKGSWVEKHIHRINRELKSRGILFKPHFWLAEEWFTPDGVPGIAIPFYLVHPRLFKLEKSQMLEIEGGTAVSCLKILRHEVGHAIDNAYHLRRKKKRQQIFGRSSKPYPRYYSPRPYSKNYVLHLDYWYAQSHPDEDFAETFAVWFTPESKWAKRYAGWGAYKKLVYMNELMEGLSGKTPSNRKKIIIESIRDTDKTLREYYEEKKKRYGAEFPGFYDRDLRRLFSDEVEFVSSQKAATFIKRIQKDVRAQVARWTGEHQYTIDQVLKEIILRAEELKLRVAVSEKQAREEFTILLTVQTMNYLHSGRHRLAL